MKTLFYKDPRNGQQGKTEVQLNAKQVLVITTSRSLQGRLDTRVIAYWTDSDGSMRHAFDFGAGGGDFNYKFQSTTVSRLTEKLVREQHGVAMTHLADFVQRANAHYAKPGAPKAEMPEGVPESVEA